MVPVFKSNHIYISYFLNEFINVIKISSTNFFNFLTKYELNMNF